ncbi:MAG: cobalt transporter CbiM [Desulfarculus sp.]|nr:cobalt transporter CbiM [Pseudomonadota bacterium]MBV1715217.1 cobalt transporter CbiM [Desulfarculus sp.]MBU4575593.1 cobalt transporter CbiM [Pseudomonadota bacterium]MBU4598236.1 cobalt transporter CbiM [Pseudomonadota bacterium]MBV1736715.1 cobalt transporter CbiM [Desulfarculus sp.]
MHISEGVLSGPVLAGGAVISAAGLALGLRSIDYDKLPRVALLSAVFFVASLIHLPVGPSSIHLVLNGLVGLILGWAAFPALFVGLVLQAVLFQFGGLTVLGVNTATMALPAVLGYYLFAPLLRRDGKTAPVVAAFAAGFCAIFFSAVLTGLSLYFSGEAFLGAAWAIVAANFPGMILEGLITAVAVMFLRKVKPELLGMRPRVE